jgi:hypothetical protein
VSLVIDIHAMTRYLIVHTIFPCDVKCWYTLVTLPCIVTPYCDSVDGTHDRVTYQKLVTLGIWPSHQRDDTVTAGAGVDVERHVACPHLLSP